MDDVLARENDSIRQFINKTYGLAHTDEDYKVQGEYWGYWERLWGVDDEQARQWFQSYLDSGIKARQKVVDGSVEAIAKLEQGHNLVIVTSRNDKLIDLTHEWLDSNFPKIFKGVEFVAVWSGGQKASKATICKSIGADYLIDDNLEHCTLAAEAGVTALLFGDYGWNKNRKTVEGVVRVRGWTEVIEYFYGKD